jgi:hypothetical protein
VPAVALWTVLGLLLNLAPVRLPALVLLAGYAMYYGLIETADRPGPPAPGRTWQVPAAWVNGAPPWRRILVWGALLGPGLATRNPYAGFAMLPLAVASAGGPRAGIALAAGIGFVHAAGRVLGLLRDMRGIASADYLLAVLNSMRWRTIDGAALLVMAGLAVSVLALRA